MQFDKKRLIPSNRLPLYDITTLTHIKEDNKDNFEYYMNREYAYNRDKGKCKVCSSVLKVVNRHCHRISEELPINKVNKVSNLAWLCNYCDEYIHGTVIPESFDKKKASKIQKYRDKLTK
jgi:RNA-directed DNA polymerase